MNATRNHAPNPGGVPRTKMQLPEIEVKIGNSVIFIEDIVTALLTDKDLQASPIFSTLVEGCNRLIEGKFWLTAALTSLQSNRGSNNGLPTMPNKPS